MILSASTAYKGCLRIEVVVLNKILKNQIIECSKIRRVVYIGGTISQRSNVIETTMICINGSLSAKHLQKKEYLKNKFCKINSQS